MRKAVKLTAVSTIAAVAMVGASATAATAHDGRKGKIGVNACGNEAGSGVAEADRLGEVEIDDIEDNVAFDNVVCQNGEENFAANINEYEGGGGLGLGELLDEGVIALPGV